jgi:hypothetical protein
MHGLRRPPNETNDKIAQLTRNPKAESDEVTRLKKALPDAQAKLDAIANIKDRRTTGDFDA